MVLAKMYKEYSYILAYHDCCWQTNMAIRVIHIIFNLFKKDSWSFIIVKKE